MEWQDRLISTYVNVCNWLEQGLDACAMRMSNNTQAELTDAEVITIYLNGIMTGRTKVKSVFNFSASHLASWFPKLGTYESFVKRLNRIADIFVGLVDVVISSSNQSKTTAARIVDSMPIVLAKASRSNRATIASELADKGYCGSKDEFYYGIKLHIVGRSRPGTIPVPEFIGTTKASMHDRPAFEQIAQFLFASDIFADKAYIHEEKNRDLKCKNDVQVVTPIKLQTGQKNLDSADSLYSTMVSKIRQPIESFFNWLQEKTGIQSASKVRSSNGLIVHTYGKLAAGLMMLLIF